MSIDRRINLNTSLARNLPDELSQELAQSGSGQRRQASDTDRHAFERALAQPGAQDADEPGRQGAQESADAIPRPFGLFGAAGLNASGTAAAASASGTPPGLGQDLAEAADRLMVADGSAGRREVRVELKDDVLPGVTVGVYEEGGRVVAAFACASEASREKLCAGAASLAAELAQSLGRPSLVRVTTDDPEDPCLFEAAADAAP